MMFKTIWDDMTKSARVGLVAGILLILLFSIALGIWAYRTNYQVLFSDLAPRDASAMAAELEKLKIPYKLADSGNTILVPEEDVYRTRLKLMGNDVPLHGSVGFEVFNNADFGMTEFVQKVNYQRAVQGELTRTILAIDDIQAARVHLALPEQGLFKKTNTKSKASVTLTLKPGKSLNSTQVTGIQRLVAASVPDMEISDVTVLDQKGVALSRMAASEGQIESASTQLDSKKAAEDYLTKKVTQVLERTLGAGEAIASVDIVLNLDQRKITTEEVLPAKQSDGNPVSGVLIRERQSIKEGTTSTSLPGDTNASGNQSGGSSTVESDYQVGRRVEQTVAAGGTLKRMTVAVVVKRSLNDAQLQKLKEMVSLAIGFNPERGDAVVVYSAEQFAAGDLHGAIPTAIPGMEEDHAVAEREFSKQSAVPVVLIAILALVVSILILAAVLFKRSRKKSRLSQRERERLLASVHLWIQGSEVSASAEASK